MAKFPCCETHNGTPCVFTDESLMRMFRAQPNAEFVRCARHGALVTGYVTAETVADARKRAKNRDCSEEFTTY